MTNTNSPSAADGGAFALGGDLRVNRLGFGAMRLATGRSAQGAEAGMAVLRRAVELGVNHIEEDLRRLSLDRLDLVYLRVGDMEEPVGKRIEALAELRDEGLIRHLDRPGLAARRLAGDPAHPRHRLPRPPDRERRGGRPAPHHRRPGRTRRVTTGRREPAKWVLPGDQGALKIRSCR